MQWPWVHHTVWQRLTSFFDRVFHHQALLERSRARKVALMYALTALLLTAIIYYAYSYDLTTFSYTKQVFPLSSTPSPSSELSDQLTRAYHNSDWVSPHSRLYIGAIIGFILLTALTSLYLSLHHMKWQILFVFKRLSLFLLFQLAYILPILVLVFVPEYVTQDLRRAATIDTQAARQEIAQADGSTKLLTQTEDITVELTNLTVAPLLLTGRSAQAGLISYLDPSPIDTFYRAVVLPSLIAQTEISDLGHPAILFPNHHLYISSDIARDDLASILSALSLKMYRLSPLYSHFEARSAPSIEFLSLSDYNELENKKAQEQQKKIETYLAGLRQEIVQNNQYLSQAEGDLNSLQSDKAAYENRVTPLLAECLALYDEIECQSASTIAAQTIGEYNAAIQTVESNLAIAKANVPLLRQAQVSARASLDKFLAFPIIPELQSGIFEPPRTILIKYAEGLTPANQYYTLLHELAHYYSHNSKANLPSFLEEGITDYVTLKVGQPTPPSAKIDGYPDEIKITQALITLLGDDQVIKLYFDKSPSAWAKQIDAKCGSGCYKKLASLGEQLTYTDLDNHETRDRIVASAKELLTL